jgi:hypothetical protein
MEIKTYIFVCPAHSSYRLNTRFEHQHQQNNKHVLALLAFVNR